MKLMTRFFSKNQGLWTLDSIIYIGILLFPILFFSTPKVTTPLATLIFLLCSFSLVMISRGHLSAVQKRCLFIVSLVFLSYPLAIIISQILRWQFEFVDYQQQGRILLLLPLFFYIYYKKIELSKLAIFIFPAACFLGAISSLFLFNGASQWGGARNTVAHIDPLNFGYLMLFLAFSSLLIGLQWAKSNWHRVLCFFAGLCGIYMSIKSGSRTGWAAIPLVVFWFLWATNRFKLKSIAAASLLLIVSGLFIYYFSEMARHRFDETVKDFNNYIWQGNPAANDSSVGVRLSMIRMAWQCFSEAPWSGYGVRNIYGILNVDATKLYATQSVIQFSSSGFMHNEFLTQLVKHGFLGGFAFLFIFYFIISTSKKLRKLNIKFPFSDVFMTYVIFALIASLSTEILVVKPMILFFGFMLACFAGEALWKIHDKEHVANA